MSNSSRNRDGYLAKLLTHTASTTVNSPHTVMRYNDKLHVLPEHIQAWPGN